MNNKECVLLSATVWEPPPQWLFTIHKQNSLIRKWIWGDTCDTSECARVHESILPALLITFIKHNTHRLYRNITTSTTPCSSLSLSSVSQHPFPLLYFFKFIFFLSPFQSAQTETERTAECAHTDTSCWSINIQHSPEVHTGKAEDNSAIPIHNGFLSSFIGFLQGDAVGAPLA